MARDDILIPPYKTALFAEPIRPDEIAGLPGALDKGVEQVDPVTFSVVHARIAKEWGVPANEADAARFGASVPDWPAFPDSAEALAYLKQHFKLGILSNVDRESFKGSNRRLGVTFDWIMTAEDIGSYKPSPRNFEFMIETLGKDGVEKGRILHTAESLFHDHVPANRFGLASCWIFRRHDKEGFGATSRPAEMPRIDFRFTSLGAMAEAHRREMAGGDA